MKQFSIVLPAYNEETNISKAVSEAALFATKRFDDFEIIVVDDGSRDHTAVALQAMLKTHKNLKVISHKKNLGYGAAVWDGLRASQGELIFFTDSDLQFDLRDLDLFLNEIKTHDAVIGYRQKRSEGLIRKLNALGWRAFVRMLLKVRAKDIDCAFKLFRLKAICDIEIISSGATFSAELLYRLNKKGSKISELPVKHFKRRYGAPTGAKMSVIAKGFKEILALRKSEKNKIQKGRNE